MANDIVHFAIHYDDGPRAKAFYENMFGWRFEPWGPPGFWLIETSPGAPVRGALQERRAPVDGDGMIGFECTVSVDDVEATARAVERNGGEVVFAPMRIEGVGTLIQFRDTERNVVCAMQYDAGVGGRE